MKNFFSVYDCIAEGVEEGQVIEDSSFGVRWASASCGERVGIAMATDGESIKPMFPEGFVGMDAKNAAYAVRSWNLREASLAMAAANLRYNTLERMEKLSCAEPYDNYCTAGLDLAGKRIGVVGHLSIPEELYRQASSVSILERMPQTGDYPDAACDCILPECDIVLITGSSIINKTLPHLLELCRDACTVLTGPSVPMCPALLDCGIDRLAGMVVTDKRGMSEKVRLGTDGSPYTFGQSWLLKK